MVANWAKTREPPYAELDDLRVQELLAAIPITETAVYMARKALSYYLKRVIGEEPLWCPQQAVQVENEADHKAHYADKSI
ncbi:hypothetical protein SEUCBS139899_004946 [Sporothrix eucalyptigena]